MGSSAVAVAPPPGFVEDSEPPEGFIPDPPEGFAIDLAPVEAQESPAVGAVSNFFREAGATLAKKGYETAQGVTQTLTPRAVREPSLNDLDQAQPLTPSADGLQAAPAPTMQSQQQFADTVNTAHAKGIDAAEFWHGKAEGAGEEFGVDPARSENVSSKIARGLAGGVGFAAEAAIPVIGLPVAVLQGAAEAKAAGYNAAKAGGLDEEAATKKGDEEAAWTFAALPVYIAGGKIAGTAIKPFVKDASVLRAFLSHAAGQSVGLEATSAALRVARAIEDAPEGQKTKAAMEAAKEFTIEGAAQNIAFGVMGAAGEVGKVPAHIEAKATTLAAADLPKTADAIREVAGETSHPEIPDSSERPTSEASPATPVSAKAAEPPTIPVEDDGLHSVHMQGHNGNPLNLEAAAREPDGTIKTAKGSVFHGSISNTGEAAEMGFADPQGNFLTREEAQAASNAARLKAYLPRVRAKETAAQPAEVAPVEAAVQAPGSEGPGAAAASEFPERGKVGAYNAKVDEQRAVRGLSPLMSAAREANPVTWDAAVDRIDADPSRPEQLVEAIDSGEKKSVSRDEQAELLWRLVDLRNKLELESERAADPNSVPEEQAAAQARAELIERQLQRTERADRTAGAAQGAALQFRQVLAHEDFTFAGLMMKARKLKDRPLTTEERTKIEAQADEIAKHQAEIERLKAELAKKSREGTAETTHTDTQKEVAASERKNKAKGKTVDVETQRQKIVDGMKKRLVEGDSANDLYSYVQKLHENLQREAIQKGETLTRDQVTNRIHDILANEIGLDIPREFTGKEGEANTQDLISGIGRSTPLTTDPVKLAKMEVRTQVQKVGKIQRFLQKMAAPRTGPERAPASPETRALEKEGRELARKNGVQVTDPAKQLATSLEAKKTRLRNEIADLDRAIDLKEPLVQKSGVIARDAETDLLTAQRDAKKAEYTAMFGDPRLSDAARLKVALAAAERAENAWKERLANAKKGIFDKNQPGRKVTSPELEAIKARSEEAKAEVDHLKSLNDPARTPEELALQAAKTRAMNSNAVLLEKIANNDFGKRQARPKPVPDDELRYHLRIQEQLKQVIEKERHEYQRKMQPWYKKAGNLFQEVRGIVLGSDIGVLTRQGLFSWARPVTATKATATAFKAALSPDSMVDWELEVRNREVNGRAAAPIRKEAGLQTTDTLTHPEELVITRLLSRIPDFNVGGKTIKISAIGRTLERFQTTFINAVRADLFDTAIKQGFSPEELKLRANFINSATGRSNIKYVPKAMSAIFTSPRYEASRWEMIAHPVRNIGSLAVKGAGGSLDRAALANLQDMAVTAAGIYGIFKLAQVAGGYTVNWNPTSTDFLKMRKGDEVWDVSAGIAPRLRDLIRLYVAFANPTYQNTIGKTLLNAGLRTINPAITIPVEQASVAQQKYRRVKKPVLPLRGFRSEEDQDGLISLAPLIVQSISQSLKDGPGQAAFTGAREFVGSSVNRYPAPKQ